MGNFNLISQSIDLLIFFKSRKKSIWIENITGNLYPGPYCWIYTVLKIFIFAKFGEKNEINILIRYIDTILHAVTINYIHSQII